jgi:predicted glutamine amidotransferase
MARAVGEVETLSCAKGDTPYMRFAACWSDGHTLYAARYASDNFAPSLFYRTGEDGVVLSSEPLDECPTWAKIGAGTASEVTGTSVRHRSFDPNVTTSDENGEVA